MASDPRDYKLDLSSLDPHEPEATSPPAAARQFISVVYACCRTYGRVYASADGKRYDARCPRCGRSMRFAVGAGGTDQRTFVVQ